MITFCSVNELEAANEALKNLEKDHKSLYMKLEGIVQLTRALNFKYHYMGALIMDENPAPFTPAAVHDSVLQLYKKELQTLKFNQDFPVIKNIFSKFKETGYTNISLLLLGMEPESLVGASCLK